MCHLFCDDKRRIKKMSIFLLPLLILLTAASLYPQGGVNGAISGSVTDPSGAAVAGVTVKITNVNTGVSYQVGTTTDGFYTVRFLIPGTYRVEVSKTGFQRAVVDNVVVQAASHPTVNMQLTLGTVAQTITVSDKTSMVEAQTADSGAVIDRPRVLDTATQNRNVFGLTWASAGVIPTSAMKSFTPYDNSGSSSLNINGSQPGGSLNGPASSEILVDGVEDRTSYNGGFVGYIPSQETVGELKVVTNPYSAEYGHTLGGAILIQTATGTNQFHGMLYEYNRSHGLASTVFDTNRAHQHKPPLLFNTPGGQIGGPIKRNKIFFFGSYYFIDNHSPTTEFGAVPTAAQRQGDFSTTYYSNGGVKTPITLYDPFSCTSTTTTCTSRAVIGTGNSIIPTAQMDPIAKNLWQYINLPNAPGDPITGANNYYASSGTGIGKLGELNARVDYNISNASRISFRAIHEAFNSYNVPFYTAGNDAAEVSGSNPFTRASENHLIDYTRTFSPTSVLDIRIGMERYFTQGLNASVSCQVSPAKLGFSSTFASQAIACMPTFGFTGAQGGGSYLGSTTFTGAGLSIGNINPDQINTVNGTFLKSLGRHTLKFGGEGVLERYYAWQPGSNAGAFSFSSQYTQQNPTGALTAAQGNPVAAFEMGVGSAAIDNNSAPARQNLRAAWFVQDDIKVTRKLTINAGLRWDWDGGLTDRFNAMTGIFNTTVASPLATQVAAAAGVAGVACPACAHLVGGPTFPGVNGLSRSPYDSSFRNFAPRVGIAYAFSPSTAFRAGWGLFYDGFVFDPGTTGFSQRTNSILFSPTYTVLNLMDNPFPTGLIPPTGSSLGLSTNLGGSISFVDPHAREPRAQQFNFNVQHQLPRSLLITVGYNYNGISRVPVTVALDYLTSAQIEQQGYTILNSAVTNPFAGLLTGTANASAALNKATVTQSQLLLPYPQFTGVSETNVPIGNSSYHSLVVQLTKRWSAGLSASISYTNSKHEGRYSYMNAFDSQLMKTIDPYDIPQILVFNGSWEFPVGKGKQFASSIPGWANHIIGGWQFNWMMRVSSGIPWSFSGNSAPVPGVPIAASPQSIDQWVNPNAFIDSTKTAFCFDPGHTPARGNCIQEWSTVNGHIRAPMIANYDLGLFKNFRITERIKFVVMNNWVNATNTPQFFSLPGACENITASCFGKIAGFQGQTNYARQIQIGGKLVF
jgi:hypothetical protein